MFCKITTTLVILDKDRKMHAVGGATEKHCIERAHLNTPGGGSFILLNVQVGLFLCFGNIS